MKLFLTAAAAIVIAAPATAQVMSPAQYVATAGASDLYEMQSSRLVLQTTQNPKIRQFAQQMITDHTKSTADVKAAAAKSRVKAMPPKLNPTQTEQIAQLRAENGTARDATYLSQQRVSHDQALNVQQTYAASGTAPALKQAAAKIVPVVSHHIEELQAM